MIQVCYKSSILQLKTISNIWSFIPRRYRYKKKWAVNLKETTNCQLALSNFDAFYKPYFADQWPAIRISLLSLPKHCAAINRYGNAEKTVSQLEDFDISNFIERARLKQNELVQKQSHVLTNKAEVTSDFDNTLSERDPSEMPALNCDSRDGGLVYPDSYSSVQSSDQNLNLFVPTQQVYSERDTLLREEISINAYEPRDSEVEVLPYEHFDISKNINAFIFPRGEASVFPQSKPHNRIIGYFLMDAASVMPVIALDVQPDDHVLDLCAAPGGKSFLMLQSLNMVEGGSLHCNDSSQGRVARLREVLNSYFPADIAGRVTVTKKDGIEQIHGEYNKVLVDAPCNSDRHVVTEDDNNLFKLSRTRDRLGLMKTQVQLLMSGIKACVPGGSIVYSTCTLSPAQNDGVIQAAVEELHNCSEIRVAVQDLTPLAEIFGHAFKFHGKSRFGQMIIPTLVNNFGPSYFAKLRRIK